MGAANDIRAIDGERFPALAEYLRSLPGGLASYPGATSLGIILKSAIASHYFHPSWKKLPREIIAVASAPPLPTSWVSTVLTDAIFCLVADTFYPSQDAMLRWNYERTARLAKVPMYKSLTRLSGVENFLKVASRIHGLFQRGTDLDIEIVPEGAYVALRHPPHLHGRLNHLSNEGVFRAVLESAGARDATVALVESTPTLARYDARWTKS